jgi:hypothetical protein
MALSPPFMAKWNTAEFEVPFLLQKSRIPRLNHGWKETAFIASDNRNSE